MTIEDREALVNELLNGAAAHAKQEATALLAERPLTLENVEVHLRSYILDKYLLPQDCTEDRITALASLSLQRTAKLDAGLLKELDRAAPCNHATSETTKKVLLLYAIQKDFGIRVPPADLIGAETIRSLANVIYHALLTDC